MIHIKGSPIFDDDNDKGEEMVDPMLFHEAHGIQTGKWPQAMCRLKI
jgi:hypothetical protein